MNIQQSKHIEEAIIAWNDVLGSEKVIWDEATLHRYSRSTTPYTTRPSAVLRPESTHDVQAIVQIAIKFKIPVYPVSIGKNWGYTDACAPTSGMVLIDLSRMNKIREINTELGYVVIEPGVTQGQLVRVLQDSAPEYQLDCTGAGPDASVLGNALDRGFGHTAYGDHVRSACGMEVVMADGTLMKTGFGHYRNARTECVYPYGIGPMLDGLFSQSNLGIVTSMGLWLMPVPETFQFFYIRCPDDEKLEALVDSLRPLRMRGVLNSAVHIGNDLRVISSSMQYPWELCNQKTPVPDAVRLDLRKAHALGAWNVSGSLTGTKPQVNAAAKLLQHAVRGIGKIVFLNDRSLYWRKKAVYLLNHFGIGMHWRRQLDVGVPNYELLKGIPTLMPLRGAFWRVRTPIPDIVSDIPLSDPLDAGCGLVWLSPVLPIRGEDARIILEQLTPILHEYGFDCLVTYTMLNERSMVAIINLSFDKNVPGESDAARTCYEEAMQQLVSYGYYPYRVGMGGMKHLVNSDDTFWQTAHRIKQTLDPDNILMPGRYIPVDMPDRH